MELSPLQNKIVNSTSPKTVVIADAGSGKTACLTEKTRLLLREGVDPRQIAVITFTNLAASELQYRLGTDYKEGIFVGTIHSLANYMLRSSGIDTSKILDEEKFDELFALIRKNQYCVKHLQWVLLDEAQDSDTLQFEFIFTMIRPENFFVIGDIKQAIYSFKGGNPLLLSNLSHTQGVKVFALNENYRCASNILNYAKKLIRPTGLIDNSRSMREISGQANEVPFDLDLLVELIKREPLYSKWAVLCRANSEVSYVMRKLEKNEIPYLTFKQGDLSREDLLEKMSGNAVKVLTIHSSKGLAFDNVIVIGMKYFSDEERRVCYVAATRARNKLYWMSGKKKKQDRTRIVQW